MPTEFDFQPNWVSPPGDTISDILKAKNITFSDFSNQINLDNENVRKLIDGQLSITIGLARKLEEVLGSSAEFWMVREFEYKRDLENIFIMGKDWLKKLPVKDMEDFGWINHTPSTARKISQCLNYFDVSDINTWYIKYSYILKHTRFRKSKTFESNPESVIAWLRQGEIQSTSIKCKPWNPDLFSNILKSTRELTQEKNPSSFIPKLQEICATTGVAVIIIRTPSGCKVNGATYRIDKDRRLLILSYRYHTDDQFWFSFFHEAGHLLLHDEDIYLEMDEDFHQEEREANDFAWNILIPKKHQTSFFSLQNDWREILRFSKKIGVSPGIVVGQLQFHKRLEYNELNNFKRKINWGEKII